MQSTFGAENGSEVSDKHTILTRIETALFPSSCPSTSSIEYLYTEPAQLIHPTTLYQHFLNYCFSWGHSALRYTLPNGEQHLININNPSSGNSMLTDTTPTDFFFSTDTSSFSKSEQYGIYMRSYIMVSLHNVDDATVTALHRYCKKLHERWELREVEFTQSVFEYAWRQLLYDLGLTVSEPGGCAQWISRAMVKCGILSKIRISPKQIAVDLLRKYGPLRPPQQQGPSPSPPSGEGLQLHVVSFRRATHSCHHSVYRGWRVDGYEGDSHALHGGVNFLLWYNNLKYRKLESLADVIVEVSPPGTEVTVTRVVRDTPPVLPPPVLPFGLDGIALRSVLHQLGESESEPLIIPALFVLLFWASPLVFLLAFVCLVVFLIVKKKVPSEVWECVLVVVMLVPVFVVGVLAGNEVVGQYSGTLLHDLFVVCLMMWLWKRFYYNYF